MFSVVIICINLCSTYALMIQAISNYYQFKFQFDGDSKLKGLNTCALQLRTLASSAFVWRSSCLQWRLAARSTALKISASERAGSPATASLTIVAPL